MTNKKIIIISAIVIVLLIIIGVVMFRGTGSDTFFTVKAETLDEQVQSSGKTKPAQEVMLGFVSSGKISKSYVKVGDKVESGELLMQLEAGDLYADLAKAKADLASENAIFASDSISLGEARENMRSVLQKSIIVADNTIQGKIDQFYELPRTSSASFRPFVFVDEQRQPMNVHLFDKQDLSAKRVKAEAVLVHLNNLRPLIASAEKPEQFISLVSADVEYLKDFVDDVAEIMNKQEVGYDDYVSQLNGYKSDIAEARIDLQAVTGDILSAQEEINTSLAQDIPGSGGQVTERDARILKAEAEVQSIQANISKTIIRSPIQGVVTKVDFDPGEIISSGTTVIGVISDNNFEIESNISEVNISKINIDNPVRITFDGIASKEFWGRVVYIEPAETIVDDVVTFKVKVALDEITSEIKSGLTANLTISTNTKENVLAVPAYAVTHKEGKSFVQKLIDDKKVEVEVQTGIVGSNGHIEILSGLNEGDVVVIAGN